MEKNDSNNQMLNCELFFQNTYKWYKIDLFKLSLQTSHWANTCFQDDFVGMKKT